MSEVAKTILSQMTVRTQNALLARDFTFTARSLSFRIGNKRSIDRVTITLNGQDTYDVRLVRVPSPRQTLLNPESQVQTLYDAKDILVDNLNSVLVELLGKL